MFEALRVLVGQGLRQIKRTAAAPFLWFTAIIGLPAFVIGAWTSGPFRWAMFLVGLMVCVCTQISLLYFMRKDPDRLQTETYRLQTRSLSIIESKAQGIQINPMDIIDILNPEAKGPGKIGPEERHRLLPQADGDAENEENSSSDDEREQRDE